MKENSLRGTILLLITACIWGSGLIAQKVGMFHMGPLLFNGTRMLIASFVLMPVALVSSKRSGFYSIDRTMALLAIDKTFEGNIEKEAVRIIDKRRRDIFAAGISCGLLTSLGAGIQQIGIKMVPVGKAGFLTILYVILVPIIGILLGRKVGIKLWVCVVIALIGFALLSLNKDAGGISKGDIIIVISALFFALQINVVGIYSHRTNPILLSMLQMFVCGITNVGVSIFVENPSFVYILDGIKPLMYSALLPGALCFTLQIIGQKKTNPTVASLVMSTESIFAMIFGVLLLGERMTGKELLGCAVIFFATALAQIPDKKVKQDA